MKLRLLSGLLSAACVAGVLLWPCGASASQNAGDEWALEIVHKEFDGKTGKLSVVVENTSADLDVTAFGVMAVVASADGDETTQIHSVDRIPGEALPPGGTQEVSFTFGIEPSPAEYGLAARTVVLHFEVRSDLSSRGNQVFVEELFQARAFQAIEYQGALNRLRQLRSVSPPEEAASKFKVRETVRALPAKRSLNAAVRGLSSEQKDQYAAMKTLADLAAQVDQVIERAGSAEAALDFYESAIESQLNIHLENARPQDIRQALHWEGSLQ